jgi:hypothetical protein
VQEINTKISVTNDTEIPVLISNFVKPELLNAMIRGGGGGQRKKERSSLPFSSVSSGKLQFFQVSVA